MSHLLGSTLRVLRPHPHILAFYDGRVPGVRAFSPEPNWLDDGAYQLGICSFAVIDAEEALVYDTQMSLAHARLVRQTLEAAGVRRMRVVLSHWHTDHIAGNAVFADCEIIAHVRTHEAMLANRSALAADMPPIDPVIMPTRTYEDGLRLCVGRVPVELRHVDIHSRDATVLLLPDGLLLAGDTLEDMVTYVAEPQGLERHLADLARMATWHLDRILPNHGDPGRIEAGGYGVGLITATQRYVDRLLRVEREPGLGLLPLREFVQDELERGWITEFAPYEAVHRRNLRVVEQRSGRAQS